MNVCLNRNQLKIIALITMLIDHIGFYLFPSVIWFRIIGRIAFPIFAFFVGEGYYHTHSKLNYFLRILIVAIISQIPFAIANNDFFFFNILFTFVFSIILIYIIEQFKNKEDKFLYFIYGLELAIALLILICFSSFYDYGIAGALLPVVFYFFRENKFLKFMLFSLIIVGFVVAGIITQPNEIMNYIQLFSFFSIPLLLLYNNESGKHNIKGLFYIFFPAHLIVFALIKIII